MNVIEKAKLLAIGAHAKQKRLYTEEPYWRHPERVAQTLLGVQAPWGFPWDDEVIAAAWLHDVVEDTPVTLAAVKRDFGPLVAQLVGEVTNPSHFVDQVELRKKFGLAPGASTRDIRKQMDRNHLAKASPEGASIKLADIIDNTSSIVEHDPGFARKYLEEMLLLLPILESCMPHPVLFERASKIVNNGVKQLETAT